VNLPPDLDDDIARTIQLLEAKKHPPRDVLLAFAQTVLTKGTAMQKPQSMMDQFLDGGQPDPGSPIGGPLQQEESHPFYGSPSVSQRPSHIPPPPPGEQRF